MMKTNIEKCLKKIMKHHADNIFENNETGSNNLWK